MKDTEEKCRRFVRATGFRYREKRCCNNCDHGEYRQLRMETTHWRYCAIALDDYGVLVSAEEEDRVCDRWEPAE